MSIYSIGLDRLIYPFKRGVDFSKFWGFGVIEDTEVDSPDDVYE